MDRLLGKLGLSLQHLTVLHEALVNEDPSYKLATEAITAIGLADFERQLYAGGKVKGKLQRQMILADIFQYIFVGRGYFAAVESPTNMRKFLALLFRVSNLLILQEDLSVNAPARKSVAKALQSGLPPDEFIDPCYPKVKSDFDALLGYKGRIVPREGKHLADIFDSLLPKKIGLACELLVFAMLLLKRYGYVVPLLMNQRLIRGGTLPIAKVDHIAPPDFLLIREKGEVFGLEVGTAKDDQNAKFCAVTSIPIFSVRLGNHRESQPYRCGFCGRFITYSSYVIDGMIAGTVPIHEESIDAEGFFAGTLSGVDESDLVFAGEALDSNGDLRDLRYHYRCVKDQATVERRVTGKTKHHSIGVVLLVPAVHGLEWLPAE